MVTLRHVADESNALRLYVRTNARNLLSTALDGTSSQCAPTIRASLLSFLHPSRHSLQHTPYITLVTSHIRHSFHRSLPASMLGKLVLFALAASSAAAQTIGGIDTRWLVGFPTTDAPAGTTTIFDNSTALYDETGLQLERRALVEKASLTCPTGCVCRVDSSLLRTLTRLPNAPPDSLLTLTSRLVSAGRAKSSARTATFALRAASPAGTTSETDPARPARNLSLLARMLSLRLAGTYPLGLKGRRLSHQSPSRSSAGTFYLPTSCVSDCPAGKWGDDAPGSE